MALIMVHACGIKQRKEEKSKDYRAPFTLAPMCWTLSRSGARVGKLGRTVAVMVVVLFVFTGIGWIMKRTHSGFLCALQNGTDGPFTSHQQFSGSSRVSKRLAERMRTNGRDAPHAAVRHFRLLFIVSLSIMSKVHTFILPVCPCLCHCPI